MIVVEKTATSDGSPHFQSIQQAVDQAKAGDTILVKEGTYHETVTVRKAGITIAAFDPCHPPVIDGADQAFGRPAWEHVQGKVYRTSYKWYKPQLTQKEFNQYGGGESADSIAMQVYEDGVLLRGYVGAFVDYGTSGYGAPYSTIDQLDPMSPMFHPGLWYKREIRIPGRFLYDEQNAKLYVWSAAEDDPSLHVYSIPVLQNLVVLNASAVSLRHLVLTNSAGPAVIVEDLAHDALIEDCCFVNNVYAIYAKRADNLNIVRNFFQQKGMWERYWYYDCKDTVLWAHAIALEHYPDLNMRHTEIEGNVIHGYYAAVLANGRASIHDNILSHCMSTLVNIDSDCLKIQIYDNVCHHVDDTAIGLSGALIGPVWVFRNLFYHCGSLNKAGTDTPNATNGMCYFYHNTLALSALIANHPYDYPVFGRHVYRNNIFHLQYLEPGNELYWRYARKDPSLGWAFTPFENGPDSDYNLYWIGPKGPSRYIAYFSYAGNAAEEYLYDDFAKMKQETGLDPHGLQVSPMFCGDLQLDEMTDMTPYDTLSTMDYRDVIRAGLSHLLAAQCRRFFEVFAVEKESPAVDSGARLPSDWPDAVPVLDSKPDIGAWETDSADGPAGGIGSLH
ncbi:MAG: hypothetical protein JW955_09885 [Sedimentisphaerales bacterium]|nr:hypothetical protein [Sedimentisphaerales bacterium]